METIIAPHETDPAKLAEVVAQMETFGAPSIMAHYDGEKYIALEGSHRIAAAAQLGLAVVIIECGEDEEIEHDFDDVQSALVTDVLEYLADDGISYKVEVA